jgi:hypothetical protein
MHFAFEGEIWYWRGPSPFHFVTVPENECHEIKAIANDITYGWGMIPARVRIGATEWKTALWPKDDRYIVPLKDAVRHAERLDLGDVVEVRLEIVGRDGESLVPYGSTPGPQPD